MYGIGGHEHGSGASSCARKQLFSMWNSSSPSNTAPFPLTSTDAPGHGHVIAVITLQPFVVVARPHGAAVLVKLRGAHLAAATSIWHGAHSWRTQPRLAGALTHRWAASSHLQGNREGEIIWSDKTNEFKSVLLLIPTWLENLFFFSGNQGAEVITRGVQCTSSSFSSTVRKRCGTLILGSVLSTHTHCGWFLHACLYCKSSHCWPVSLGCLDSAEFIHSLLLARDLSHLPAPEPTCYCS